MNNKSVPFSSPSLHCVCCYHILLVLIYVFMVFMLQLTPAITGGKKLHREERPAQLFDVRVYGIVYAQHGHELMR